MNSSLRLRLVAIILFPLLFISGIVAALAVIDARERANDRFDRSLLSAALAISRDVAVSDGDALSPETNALLQDTSGGRVFYHVYAPDGAFVTGYATPPVPQKDTDPIVGAQTYFDGAYLSRDVRVLRFTDAMLIDGLAGDFTFTVWQDATLRRAIVQDLSFRTFLVMGSLIGTVALVVWFGVRIGLKPLLSLEAAIARRSPDDLTGIQRQVPVEAKGIVATLNRLFGQVTETLETKDVFISNAAHQLRNPIAGVVAMSEAVRSAKSFKDMKERSVELAKASRQAGELANKLLAFERASARQGSITWVLADGRDIVHDVTKEFSDNARQLDVLLKKRVPNQPALFRCDVTMVKEALRNLVDNALLHGGNDLTEITVTIKKLPEVIVFRVNDNGIGIPEGQLSKAIERFGQLTPSSGSGLGLAIAEAVAKSHGGRIYLDAPGTGLSVSLEFPCD